MHVDERWEQTWPARPESVAEARSAVVAAASRLGAVNGHVHGIRLAVSEACSNAVMHGYVGTEPESFSVRVDRTDGRLRVVVRDHGHGMRPRLDSPGAGLGLPIISSVAESFEVRVPPDGVGTELCMTFSLDA